ncbi:hypothetical protein SAMN05446589_3117 [Streptomyces sp. OV198]|uniref:hypothetical protein n=1 Tax=Streptomyces sp. OV198 TaxID=1882787 RepID=UPI000BD9E44F|nr:hypothetical protein [Streptomyces sp. OV198]SOE67727.1 hypothetical protein SAMN05446589_3117 [Streptomyces sp. OV198]
MIAAVALEALVALFRRTAEIARPLVAMTPAPLGLLGYVDRVCWRIVMALPILIVLLVRPRPPAVLMVHTLVAIATVLGRCAGPRTNVCRPQAS